MENTPNLIISCSNSDRFDPDVIDDSLLLAKIKKLPNYGANAALIQDLQNQALKIFVRLFSSHAHPLELEIWTHLESCDYSCVWGTDFWTPVVPLHVQTIPFHDRNRTRNRDRILPRGKGKEKA